MHHDLCVYCERIRGRELVTDEAAASDWVGVRLRQQAVRGGWSPRERAIRHYGPIGIYGQHVEVTRATAAPPERDTDD